ncbi:hypothetical protein JMJ55_00575 [Belnapia sp. T6]|uniref:Hemolysin-type calcium-binding repeat-containing protein n=1 Tax=Belnapia mucosa TaxID=2804532 RepID=A0ABS1UWD8_9PROT|nr:calcium-binding protein [Belnapia mucosa]MBL6453793.1 hypothetical protein [Belnapia mucosa]
MPKQHGPIFGSTGADTIHTGSLDDLIYGDGLAGPHAPIFPGPSSVTVIAANTITAGAGNDTVYAGYGADQVQGGRGNDQLFGYGVLEGDDAWGSARARDSDLGDTISGGTGNDSIHGGGGNDVLRGDGGDDVLEGGVGADTLTGGAGQDIFRFGEYDSRAKFPVFDTPGDVVTDFRHGQDKLDLTPFLSHFGPALQADFLGEQAFTDATHMQVRAVTEGDHTLVEIYVPLFSGPNPPAGPSATITLLGHPHLDASDFILA